jgi:hypothetical protein
MWHRKVRNTDEWNLLKCEGADAIYNVEVGCSANAVKRELSMFLLFYFCAGRTTGVKWVCPNLWHLAILRTARTCLGRTMAVFQVSGVDGIFAR